MSALGRVFIVLNLVLAAAFVGFAGTFLQRHTDYKQRFTDKETELAALKLAAEGEKKELDDQLNAKDRELRAHKSQLDAAENENKTLREKSQQLEAQLADLAADVKNIGSQTTAMAQEIQQSGAQSKQAYEMAMTASHAKDEALSQKEAAEASSGNAQRKIAELEAAVAEQNGRIAALQQENSEKDVLLTTWRTKLPGITANMMQPDIRGVVQTVQGQGDLLTVRVTDNPGSAEVKPGYTFAIYKANTYKGEAVIQDVQGEFVFCRMTKKMDGATVQVGDAATTNVGL